MVVHIKCMYMKSPYHTRYFGLRIYDIVSLIKKVSVIEFIVMNLKLNRGRLVKWSHIEYDLDHSVGNYYNGVYCLAIAVSGLIPSLG